MRAASWPESIRDADEVRAQAGVEEDGHIGCCRQGCRRCHECAECVAMRGHSTNPAAIEAEIAHLRSLALDALRRYWRVIFGRTAPAALSKDLLRRIACRTLSRWSAVRRRFQRRATSASPERARCSRTR